MLARVRQESESRGMPFGETLNHLLRSALPKADEVPNSPAVTHDRDRDAQDLEFLARMRSEAASLSYVPSLEDVRRAMAKIPGSLTADFIAERGEC